MDHSAAPYQEAPLLAEPAMGRVMDQDEVDAISGGEYPQSQNSQNSTNESRTAGTTGPTIGPSSPQQQQEQRQQRPPHTYYTDQAAAFRNDNGNGNSNGCQGNPVPMAFDPVTVAAVKRKTPSKPPTKETGKEREDDERRGLLSGGSPTNVPHDESSSCRRGDKGPTRHGNNDRGNNNAASSRTNTVNNDDDDGTPLPPGMTRCGLVDTYHSTPHRARLVGSLICLIGGVSIMLACAVLGVLVNPAIGIGIFVVLVFPIIGFCFLPTLWSLTIDHEAGTVVYGSRHFLFRCCSCTQSLDLEDIEGVVLRVTGTRINDRTVFQLRLTRRRSDDELTIASGYEADLPAPAWDLYIRTIQRRTQRFF